MNERARASGPRPGASFCWLLLPCVLAANGSLLAQSLPEGSPVTPPRIEPNLGQWDARALHRARRGQATVWFENRGWTLALEHLPADPLANPVGPGLRTESTDDAEARGVAVRMTFEGARPAQLSPTGTVPGLQHYLLGKDPSRWVRDVPAHSGLRYDGLWPGIGVRIGAERTQAAGGLFEYDLDLAPGAAVASIVMRCEGCDGLRLRSDGSLVIATTLGDVVQTPPLTFSTTPDGTRQPVACRYVLRGADRFGFAVDGWSGASPLTIDPGLVWSTYLGGNGNERVQGVDVHTSGAITVTGQTFSSNFPTSPGVYQVNLRGTQDAFVTRFAADGTRLFSTYLGGTGYERSWGIAVAANLEPTIAGQTGSADFPVKGAWQAGSGGGQDAFVSRLDAPGRNLVWSTYHGGNGTDFVQGMTQDAAGLVTIGGGTLSSNLPTTPNAWQATFQGGTVAGDGFVLQLSAVGQGVYSTYYGGSDEDYVSGIAAGPGPYVTLALGTHSINLLPTPNAFQAAFGGGNKQGSASGDVFVARLLLGATSTLQLYASYFGGPSNEWPFACEASGNGPITIAGGGLSVPTTPGAIKTSLGGSADGFLSRLDPNRTPQSQLVYSTYVGGSGYDNAWGMRLGPDGAATVFGITGSTDFPATAGAFQSAFGGGNGNTFPQVPADGFLARIRLDLTLPVVDQLVYATYVCAPNSPTNETVHDARVGADGVAMLVGSAETGFPIRDGSLHGGALDGYVLQLVTTPGFVEIGTTCVQTSVRLAVNLACLPRIGQPFEVGLTNLAATQLAILYFGFQRLPASVDLWQFGMPGCQLQITPAVDIGLGTGRTLRATVPNIAGFIGGELFLQALATSPGANAANLILTNAGHALIGR